MDEKEMNDIFATLEETPAIEPANPVPLISEPKPAFQVGPAYRRPWWRKGGLLWIGIGVIGLAVLVFVWMQSYQPSQVQETVIEVVPVQPTETVLEMQDVPQFVPLQDKDTDGDGILDQREKEAGTSVTEKDTDKDGLSDFMEIQIYGTDPVQADTDKDTFSDGQEVQSGYNPKGEGKLLDLQKAIMNSQQ